jgi:hypothetical protein
VPIHFPLDLTGHLDKTKWYNPDIATFVQPRNPIEGIVEIK